MPLRGQKMLFLAGLILAAESIYLLPYLRKTFQTSMELYFHLSSTQIGILNTVFGLTAFLCYWPGGWLADRYPARKLLILSLLSTAISGLGLLAHPSLPMLILIHAFWGVSSILPFWGALIKATRQWGHSKNQGRTFGALDAGRGAIAALMTSIAAVIFAQSDTTSQSLENVIILYISLPLLAAGILAIFVNRDIFNRKSTLNQLPFFQALKSSFQSKRVVLLAGIVFCAYFLYLGTFDFPAYVEKSRGATKVFAAQLGAIRDWMRPVAALLAGVLADRFRTSRVLSVCFLGLLLSFGSLAWSPGDAPITLLVWIQILTAAIAAFALRGIYFATIEELGFPVSRTGLIVGTVSIIGFMPDIFVHLLSGLFVDQFGWTSGFRDLFGIYALVAITGLGCSLFLQSASIDQRK